MPTDVDDIEEDIRRNAPSVDMGEFRRRRESMTRLEEERARQRERTEEPPAQYVLRRSVPFTSALHNFGEDSEYANAMGRIRNGVARPGDASFAANYERTREIDAERGFLGQLGSAAAHLPAIAGEFAVGGGLTRGIQAAEGAGLATRGLAYFGRAAAMTPAIPSSYLPQLARDNIAAGRDAADPRGLPASMGTAYVNNLLLGSIGSVVSKAPWLSGPGLGRAVGRTLLAGPVGVGEQIIADIVTSFSGMRTEYGTLVDLYRGDKGEALQQAAIQALTFAAFSAMHEGKRLSPWQVPDSLREFRDTLAESRADKLDNDQAGQTATEAGQEYHAKKYGPEVFGGRGNQTSLSDFARPMQTAQEAPGTVQASTGEQNAGLRPPNAPERMPEGQERAATPPQRPQIDPREVALRAKGINPSGIALDVKVYGAEAFKRANWRFDPLAVDYARDVAQSMGVEPPGLPPERTVGRQVRDIDRQMRGRGLDPFSQEGRKPLDVSWIDRGPTAQEEAATLEGRLNAPAKPTEPAAEPAPAPAPAAESRTRTVSEIGRDLESQGYDLLNVRKKVEKIINDTYKNSLRGEDDTAEQALANVDKSFNPKGSIHPYAVEYAKRLLSDLRGEVFTHDEATNVLREAGLDKRSVEVLLGRLSGPDKAKETQQKLGDRLGITRERVRQIEANALNDLAKHLGEEGPVKSINQLVNAPEKAATRIGLRGESKKVATGGENADVSRKTPLEKPNSADEILGNFLREDEANGGKWTNESIAKHMNALEESVKAKRSAADDAINQFLTEKFNDVRRKLASTTRRDTATSKGIQEPNETSPTAPSPDVPQTQRSGPTSLSRTPADTGAGAAESVPARGDGDQRNAVAPSGEAPAGTPKGARFASGMPGGEEGPPPGRSRPNLSRTSNANAQSDIEAKRLGMPTFAETLREEVSNQETMNRAMKVLDKDPDYGKRLVESVLRDPRPITDAVDQAILLHREVSLKQQEASISHAIAGEKDPATLADLQQRLEQNHQDQQNYVAASRLSGTATGRSLQFRQAFAKADYSIGRLRDRAQAADPKTPLTEAETKVLAEQASSIEAARKEAAAAEAAHDAAPSPANEEKYWEAQARYKLQIQKPEQFIESRRWKAMPIGDKVWDMLKQFRIWELIQGAGTLGKVGSSGVLQTGAPPVYNAAASLLKAVPWMRPIAEKAVIEGHGFDPAVEKAAMQYAKDNYAAEAKRIMLTGEAKIDTLFGPTRNRPRTFLDYPGDVHNAEKMLPFLAEWKRVQSILEANWTKNGRNTDTIAAKREIAQQAYDAAMGVKFQEPNRGAEAVDVLVKYLTSPKAGAVSNTAGRLIDLLVPIRKTPMNIVNSAFEHILGLPIGAMKTVMAHVGGTENLKPAEAESIMRMMKRGMIGMPLLALGYFASGQVGGFYSGRRKEDEVKEGEIATPLGNLPAWVTAHHPAFMALQVGASIRRAEEEIKKDGPQGLGMGLAKALGGLLEEVPVMREQTEIARAFEGGFNANAIGRIAASFAVPAMIQFAATQTDRDEGKPALRKPEGFLQQIEARVPGLRQLTPEKFQEVEDVHTGLNRLNTAMQAHRQNPQTAFTPFPQERERRILDAHSREITRLQHLLDGIQNGRATGRKPDEGQATRIRERQRALARQALERVK